MPGTKGAEQRSTLSAQGRPLVSLIVTVQAEPVMTERWATCRHWWGGSHRGGLPGGGGAQEPPTLESPGWLGGQSFGP